MKQGTLAAFAAYLFWGVSPIYWKVLQSVPAFEILGHRIFWSFILLFLLITVRKEWSSFQFALKQPKIWLTFLLSASLLSINWVVYIWAVNNGYIVDASLGYFINPLVNVLLGMFFLKERLRRGQFGAVLIAAVGVTYLALSYGVVLWIALTLASCFGFYGLLRKTAPLGSFQGLSLEIMFLILPALGYLLYLESMSAGTLTDTDPMTMFFLAFTGVITVIPLLLFTYGAQRVTLTTLGILQYVVPTLNFLIGVMLYGEALTATRMIGFSIIWTALALYTVEGVLHARARTTELPLGA